MSLRWLAASGHGSSAKKQESENVLVEKILPPSCTFHQKSAYFIVNSCSVLNSSQLLFTNLAACLLSSSNMPHTIQLVDLCG